MEVQVHRYFDEGYFFEIYPEDLKFLWHAPDDNILDYRATIDIPDTLYEQWKQCRDALRQIEDDILSIGYENPQKKTKKRKKR